MDHYNLHHSWDTEKVDGQKAERILPGTSANFSWPNFSPDFDFGEWNIVYPSVIKRGNGKTLKQMEVYSWENHQTKCLISEG